MSNNDIQRSKILLRRRLLEKRLSLDKNLLKKKSNVIQDSVLALAKINAGNSLGVFVDVNNEVQTKKVINELKDRGKKVYLPKFHKNEWFYTEFSSWKDIEEGPFGIPQPISNKRMDVKSLDVVTLPGVAFSKNGHRLGYGKGVYDQMFHKSCVYKIGLAFAFQIVDKLPKEKHDLKVDLIVTENEIIETI